MICLEFTVAAKANKEKGEDNAPNLLLLHRVLRLQENAALGQIPRAALFYRFSDFAMVLFLLPKKNQ